MRDDDKLLAGTGAEFGSGVIGVCDICGTRQAVIVLEKERYKLCVIDFLNKTWLRSEKKPGAPLSPYRSERIWYETEQTPSGRATAIQLVPTKPVRHPVVLIAPDTYGLTTTLLDAAIRFAKEGMEVLLPDVAKVDGIGMRQHFALRSSARFRGGVSLEAPPVARLVRLYRDGLAYLRSREMVDPARSAVFGTSYGASLALGVAAQDVRLAAVALAYPVPVHPATFPGLVNAPLFVAHAGADALSRRAVAQFEAVRSSLQSPIEIVEFPGMRHDFLSRDLGAYDLGAAESAWDRILGFLKGALLPAPPRPLPPPIRTAPPPSAAAAP